MSKSALVYRKYYFRLIIASALISLLAALLAFSLKWITEFFEEKIFHSAAHKATWLFILLPTIGITAIYFLRKMPSGSVRIRVSRRFIKHWTNARTIFLYSRSLLIISTAS